MRPSTASLTQLTPRCRICYESLDSSNEGPLIRPCNCSGSMALVHIGCLNHWLKTKADTRCELCQTPFEVVFCGLKDWWQMTLPQPLADDWESHFEFCFLGFWLVDTISLLFKMLIYGPGYALSRHLTEKFGSGWLLYFGFVCTFINLLYYGAIFILVLDQWLWKNSVFIIQDRNTISERRKILNWINRTERNPSFVTAREITPKLSKQWK